MDKKSSSRLTKLVVFCAVGYVMLDMLGNLLLSRVVEDAEDKSTPADLVRTPIDARWSAVMHAMEATPPKGRPLTYSELERAKELVWVGLTAHPDEWEGGDIVPSSLRTLQYLILAYPNLSKHISPQDGGIRLRAVHEHISSTSVSKWRVPFVELLSRMK